MQLPNYNPISFASLVPGLAWMCNREFVWQSLLGDSGYQGCVLHRAARIFRPFDHCFGFTKRSQQRVIAAISRLGLVGRPIAIAGMVALAVIPAFQRKPDFEPVFVSPFFKSGKVLPAGESYTSASVSGVVLGSGKVAAVPSSIPTLKQRTIFRGLGHRIQVATSGAVQGSSVLDCEFDFAIDAGWHWLSPYSLREIQAGKLISELPAFDGSSKPPSIPRSV